MAGDVRTVPEDTTLEENACPGVLMFFSGSATVNYSVGGHKFWFQNVFFNYAIGGATHSI